MVGFAFDSELAAASRRTVGPKSCVAAARIGRSAVANPLRSAIAPLGAESGENRAGPAGLGRTSRPDALRARSSLDRGDRQDPAARSCTNELAGSGLDAETTVDSTLGRPAATFGRSPNHGSAPRTGARQRGSFSLGGGASPGRTGPAHQRSPPRSDRRPPRRGRHGPGCRARPRPARGSPGRSCPGGANRSGWSPYRRERRRG